jgi:hypothetical protein
MKKTIFKALKLSLVLTLTTAVVSCSTENELENSLDDFNTKSSKSENLSFIVDENDPVCTPENAGARIYTYSGPGEDVNKTTVFKTREIDDRTCTYNYTQETFAGRTHGVYKLKANSNHIDNLQPRIERASRTVNTTGNGSYIRFSGYVTIRRAGHQSSSISRDSLNNPSGTYLIQAKGKHTNPDIGSNDPAICLLVAKPRFSGGNQVSYDIYREQITKRGGSGTDGRSLIFLVNIPANTRKFLRMENGFRANNQQYVNVRIGATDYDWDVPNSIGEENGLFQRGTQAKIRFGAYRCKGGEADVLWDGVSQTFNEVP